MKVAIHIHFEWPPGTSSRQQALQAVEAMARMLREAREGMEGDLRSGDTDEVIGRYCVEFK